MTIKEIELAQLMLNRIKEEPELSEYLKVSEIPMNEDEISLAELFYRMDIYYNKAATMKSALLFLTEDVGVEKGNCILIVAVANKALYETIAEIVAKDTEGFIVARAKSLKEATELADYFSLGSWSCGLVTEVILPDGPCTKLLEKCESLPTAAIGWALSTPDYIRLLGKGANVIIDALDSLDIEKDIQLLLVEMFLD